MTGRVYLVGAGPGDPELLTRKAFRLLQAADVVLHDDLVSPQILALASPAARIVGVGKRCGLKKLTQADINRWMVEFAREGRTVVRLKGGDPLLFSRAGEEIAALRLAGIPFEIVPGITAASAGAAAARVPLTDRNVASKLVFLTAHRCRGGVELDSATLAAPDTSFIIYMPGDAHRLATILKNASIDRRTPCLVISRASLPEERVHRTVVCNLAKLLPLSAPSLVIVGAVVSLSSHPLEVADDVATVDRA